MAILNPNDIFFTPFEPKVKNRFIMLVGGIPTYLIKKIGALSVEMGEIKLNHINVYRKIKGRAAWSDLEMTLFDPITPSGAQAVMEWVRLSHESVTGRDGYSDFYKKDVRMSVLGPVGDVVSEWKIKGAYVKSATFGDYDWASDSAISISLTLAMDYCVLNY